MTPFTAGAAGLYFNPIGRLAPPRFCFDTASEMDGNGIKKGLKNFIFSY